MASNRSEEPIVFCADPEEDGPAFQTGVKCKLKRLHDVAKLFERSGLTLDEVHRLDQDFDKTYYDIEVIMMMAGEYSGWKETKRLRAAILSRADRASAERKNELRANGIDISILQPEVIESSENQCREMVVYEPPSTTRIWSQRAHRTSNQMMKVNVELSQWLKAFVTGRCGPIEPNRRTYVLSNRSRAEYSS